MSIEQFPENNTVSDLNESADSSAETPAFEYYAEARTYGEYLGLPQVEDETDSAYRSRISGVLRAQGRIIEAHEVASGRRYNDPEQGPTGPMVGIMGAVAQALGDRRPYSRNPESQVGDDIAAGVIATHEGSSSERTLAAMFDLFGPAATMDILDAFGDDRR